MWHGRLAHVFPPRITGVSPVLFPSVCICVHLWLLSSFFSVPSVPSVAERAPPMCHGRFAHVFPPCITGVSPVLFPSVCICVHLWLLSSFFSVPSVSSVAERALMINRSLSC